MKITEYIHEGITLARYIPSKCWNEGLGFYSQDNDFIQVGSWQYQKGKELLRHYHKEAPRTVSHTQEVLHIRTGKILAKIYTPEKSLFTEIQAGAGDTLILLHGGHGYTILEDNTQVLEIKNGPYFGAEIDRERF